MPRNSSLKWQRKCFEADLKILTSREAKIFVKGNPSKAVTVSDVARGVSLSGGGFPIVGRGAWDPPSELQTKETRDGNTSGAYSYGTQMCQVEVDPETGKVKVLNFVAAHDSGKVINPMRAKVRLKVRCSRGSGYALTEAMAFEDGKVMNPNFADYKIPWADDMPEKIKIHFVETCMEPTGPFGAKGLGEAGSGRHVTGHGERHLQCRGGEIKGSMTPERY